MSKKKTKKKCKTVSSGTESSSETRLVSLLQEENVKVKHSKSAKTKSKDKKDKKRKKTEKSAVVLTSEDDVPC